MLERIFISHDVLIPRKITIIRTMIFPVIFYGSKYWTLKNLHKKSIDALKPGLEHSNTLLVTFPTVREKLLRNPG